MDLRRKVRSAIALGCVGTVLAAFALGGCAARYPMQVRTPVRHVIIVDLRDAADSDQFSRDCGALLQIPGVVNVVTGPGIEAGQSGSVACDVGVVLDLWNSGACEEMVKQPVYQGFLDKWRARAVAISAVSFGPHCEDDAIERSGVGIGKGGDKTGLRAH